MNDVCVVDGGEC